MIHPKMLRLLILSALSLLAIFFLSKEKQQYSIQTPLFSGTPLSEGTPDDPYARAHWEKMRLADPLTGELPKNYRANELAFRQQLVGKRQRAQGYTWENRGPYNVGGRTRALAIDVTDENVFFAGGVSGGLWRTENQGQDWEKITDPGAHHSITCIAQDTRTGKTNIWYYGSGEGVGNSANASFSADYQGNGMYKSIDGGMTWSSLAATVSGTPEVTDHWDKIWNVVTDPSNLNEDEVYAATIRNILRSVDGGTTWDTVLNPGGLSGFYTDIAITSTGILYAAISADGTANGGIWRSTDGISWTNINPGNFPVTTRRMVLAIDPNDEDKVYVLASTPNSGLMTQVFFGGTEWNSLWKYEYISGDGTGAGGNWDNLSQNLPNGLGDFGNFNVQGSYNMAIAVKPGDPNTIFIGGTNVYRSTDGFTTNTQTSWIGGYEPFTTLPYFEIYENHHPDQHKFLFLPSDPDVLISASDGGVSKTLDCTANTVVWDWLNNGYVTSQLYTIALDHGTTASNEIICGTQDNGSWWNDSDDPASSWTMPSTGDGAFCAVEDGGGTHYFSRQRGKVLKVNLDNAGIPTAFNRMDPIGGDDYLFINPFILDPIDNNVMYLAEGSNLWRNDSLSDIPYDNEYDSIALGWFKYSSTASGQNITALAASRSPAHRLYYGTNLRRIYRVDNANTGDPAHQDVTSNIVSGGYTNCIAVDPRNADKVAVVYSNYNVYSLYYSDNGGTDWTGISGNLESEPPPGAPPGLGLGDGPSCRWLSIIPVDSGKTVYLLGTSVGLFATDTLMGDSTFWVPQAGSTVGNVVVDMIDYRQSDGFVTVGTHGNGVYVSNITSIDGINGIKDQPSQEKISSRLFPNPATDRTTLVFELTQRDHVSISIVDLTGKTIKEVDSKNRDAGHHQIEIKTDEVSPGIYFVRIHAGEYEATQKLIVK